MTFFIEHRHNYVRFGRWLTGNTPDGEDLYQLTYLHLADPHYAGVDYDPEEYDAFLCSCMRFRWFALRKKLRARVTHIPAEEWLLSDEGSATAGVEARFELREGLEALSPKNRKAILLSAAGYSATEIKKVTGDSSDWLALERIRGSRLVFRSFAELAEYIT